jgi:hypothetical protein
MDGETSTEFSGLLPKSFDLRFLILELLAELGRFLPREDDLVPLGRRSQSEAPVPRSHVALG